MSEIGVRMTDDGMGRVAVIGEAETAIGKVAAWVPVTQEMVEDSAGMASVKGLLAVQLRRYTHPWEFPDDNPFPKIDPVPWFTRRLVAYRSLRQRIRDPRWVLGHGLPEPEDRW